MRKLYGAGCKIWGSMISPRLHSKYKLLHILVGIVVLLFLGSLAAHEVFLSSFFSFSHLSLFVDLNKVPGSRSVKDLENKRQFYPVVCSRKPRRNKQEKTKVKTKVKTEIQQRNDEEKNRQTLRIKMGI